MTVDDLIKLNEEYIAILEKENSSNPVQKQYLEMAIEYRVDLEKLKKGIPLRNRFMFGMIDSFDWEAPLFKAMNKFIEAHPELRG